MQVAGGNGEQVISRDVYRIGNQFDFFRLLAFYHRWVHLDLQSAQREGVYPWSDRIYCLSILHT
jgi:hypothetical protein